ncbi:cation-translocating P-type ATPase [Candidatus Bathyarchaeota archaeon]|nr:cation-translocating P-type ATPase [Candidatus Bathyarchaeota archaeon]
MKDHHDHDEHHCHEESCDCGHNHEEPHACTSCSTGPGIACTSCENSHDGSCASCGHDHDHSRAGRGLEVLVLSGVAIALGIALPFLGFGGLIPRLLLVSAMVVTGYPMALGGFKGLLKGKVGIDLLVTIAAVGAALIGEFEEGALVVFLKDISLRLEVMASDRARHAIEALMELRPEVATILDGEDEVSVLVEQVLPGQVFIVKPGDRLPLDGVVVDGNTTVDQSTITGESVPVPKGYLDEVFAGTINLDGFLAVKTTRQASETMLASILRMVHEAEDSRSPTETIVNRFARYYTPLIITLAAVIAVAPPILLNAPLIPSVYNGLVLLVIGCPCALTIATPVAMVSAITSASRNGVLVKGSTYIESMSDAKVFAFDKTGTLTQGRLRVTDIKPRGVERRRLLGIAASLEEKSRHPIAEAIKELALAEAVDLFEVSEFISRTGKGVEAVIDGVTYRIGSQRLFTELDLTYPDGLLRQLDMEGKTTVMVARDTEIIGLISLMDQRRAGARETVEALRSSGMKVEMLTGDNETTAAAIAAQLGFNGYHANLLPDEKVGTIESLKRHGPVVMVGDGVNDAPALAAADVGVAMGGLGSDIALETADIVLLEDDLTKIGYVQRLSKVTLRRVKENISVSLLVKLAIVVLATMGTISLWMSVILGDVGLALLVILNSIRISSLKP